MTNSLSQRRRLKFVPTLFLFGFCIARGASSHPSRLGLISSLILQQRVNAKFGMHSSSLQAPVSVDLVWFSCISQTCKILVNLTTREVVKILPIIHIVLNLLILKLVPAVAHHLLAIIVGLIDLQAGGCMCHDCLHPTRLCLFIS